MHRISASAGQEAFFEGHTHAFQVLGGVPAGKVRYDNLKAAVAQVLGFSRARTEADRWTAFRSHYDLEAFYCQPGIRGAHEKGGVEGQVGWFRRNHLVPVPEVDSLAELNAFVDECDQADDARRIGGRVRTVGQAFAAEKSLLKPLPTETFETGRWFTPRVDRYAQVAVRGNKYSVPARLIGRQVRVLLGASELTVHEGHSPVATHERLMTKGAVRLELDHYLEVFTRKPGAFPGATALEQARAAGRFTPTHDAWWASAVKAHGDAEGTRALIDVLLLHRRMRHEDVVAGIAAALQAGALTADAVALEARRLTDEAADASIDQACRMLRLPTIRSTVDQSVHDASKDGLSYRGFLAELLLAECDDRARRRSERRVKAAHFPRTKSLHTFDFDANPEVDPAVVHQLATCDWVNKGEPLCLIGDSGTGKSHLLIALGTEAAMAGYRVRYTLATKLVNELVEAADDLQLSKTIARYGRVDLLLLDELGYMQLDKRGAELLFQVLTEREETNSIAIASNASFSEWTNTFTDPRLCAAIVDRLTFGGNIIQTGTVSYRLAQAQAQSDAQRE